MFSLPQVTVGDTAVMLYALLALLFCLLGAAAGAVCLKRRGWKTGPALLFGLAAGVLGLLLGRALYFAVRSEYFLDPMGRFVGLAPFFNFSLGGVCAVGVIPGLFLGGWLACRAAGRSAAEAFDALASSALLLFAALSFIEPLSGQGYGPALSQPALCRVPLGVQNGWGDWLLSVSFVEGLLLLAAAGVTARLRLRRPGSRTMCALALMACVLIVPESLRRDDVLRVFVFARVTQLGYCAMLILSAVLIFKRAYRAGVPGGTVLRESFLLLAAVLLLVAGEFALDKTEWPDGLIYLAMSLALIGTAWMLLHRALDSEKRAARAGF